VSRVRRRIVLFGRRTNVPKRKAKQIPENTPVDPNALVQQVLRESYLQTTEDLRFYAEKVRYFNQCKKAIRDYLQKLRDYRANVICAAHKRGVDLNSGNEKDLRVLAEMFKQCAHSYNGGDLEYELGVPNRVPVTGVNSVASIDKEIDRWEQKLASLGDDAQLANVDLQNILQKQQQTLQMLSNISKMLYDTAMAVIRKFGG
jgi:hypothetical protein